MTTLLALDGTTAAPNGQVVSLSAPITTGYGTGIFAGYGRVVLANGVRVYDILLPSGQVVDRGAMATFSRAGCENWAFWGVAEFGSDGLALVHLQAFRIIVRRRVPDGATTTVGTFSNLSDMCGFTVSPATGRWSGTTRACPSSGAATRASAPARRS